MCILDTQMMEDIRKHALNDKPNECCGLVISKDNNYSYFPCKNISYAKTGMAILDPFDYMCAANQGEIVGHAHSQPSDKPSLLDNFTAHNHNIYSIVYSWGNDKFYIIEPKLKEYLDKDFEIGKYDCLQLVRDYYKQELNIEIYNYKRDSDWFKSNPKIVYENINRENLRDVNGLENAKKHDILFFGKDIERIQHMGIYLDNGLILHHPRITKSCIEYITDDYKKKIVSVVRHKNYE